MQITLKITGLGSKPYAVRERMFPFVSEEPECPANLLRAKLLPINLGWPGLRNFEPIIK